MKIIQYLISDDHHIFRKGLKLALQDDYRLKCIGEAEDGAKLMELLQISTPDVVLLDLKMPQVDGFEALKAIKQDYPALKVIILTMHDDEQLILHLMEAGANGYLVKNAEPQEIKNAIHAVHEKGYYFSDIVSNAMLKKIVRQDAPLTKHIGSAAVLNEKEKEVLKLICEELTATEIAERIYLSPRTIEGIRAKLLEKTGTRNIAGLVLYAVKNGIIN